MINTVVFRLKGPFINYIFKHLVCQRNVYFCLLRVWFLKGMLTYAQKYVKGGHQNLRLG